MKVAVPLPKNVLVPLVTMTSASAIYGAIQKKKKKKKNMCGRKIWQNIEKSQNIMKLIVCKIFYCILCFY